MLKAHVEWLSLDFLMQSESNCNRKWKRWHLVWPNIIGQSGNRSKYKSGFMLSCNGYVFQWYDSNIRRVFNRNNILVAGT